MKLYNGQLKNYKFDIVTKKGKYKNGSNRRSTCYDIFCFDLENTNAWLDDNGDVIPYKKGMPDEYWNNKQTLSLVYIWQFSVNDTVYYGRDLWDFINVLNDLPQDTELQIFIHNLSHEFCFLQNILTVDSVFARSPHKPMKCTFKEYPNITFRCSYIMTNLSLADWGKQIGFNKKVGLLDYDSQLRTPLTHITDDELTYCEYDVLVMYHGIKQLLNEYDTVFDIPLTNTGQIRRVVKKLLFDDNSYSYYIKKQVPTLDEYELLLKAFQGGYCHCNKLHSCKTIDNDYLDIILSDNEEHVISHFDFTSSYPTVLLSEMYPISRFYIRDRHDIVTNKSTRNKYCFLYVLKFTNLRSINPNTYISVSKCTYNGDITRDNGRVINCYGELYYTCTDVDFDIIKWLYKWDKLTVIDSYYAHKGYLPKPFLNYVLQLYSDKTTLKGVVGEETFYLKQKGRLNSLYGMTVTSLIPNECVLNSDGSWCIKTPSTNDVIKKLRELSDTKKLYDHEYFMSFSTGVFCTAYARKNLFKCALGYDDNGNQHNGTNNGYNCIYFDTDSIFCIGRPDFDWYNTEILAKLQRCCDIMKLDYHKISPRDIKGIEHPLGVFDSEEDIQTFKCLHAKAYLELRFDNKLYMTISGINKAAVNLLGNNDVAFDNFSNGFIFDKDAECVRKLIPTYEYNQPNVIYPDGYISRFKYGKNLRATGYKLSVTDEYQRLLDNYALTFADLSEEQLITFEKDII